MPLVTRAAHAATAAYQRAMTSKRERLYQQENQRLRQEDQWLRSEVRHCREADEDHRAREVEQAYLRGVAAATVTAHAEQQCAVDEALARGFEAGRGVAGLSANGVGLTPEVIAAARAIARKLLGDVT
nr:hypothetical protein [Salinispora cortesiana]